MLTRKTHPFITFKIDGFFGAQICCGKGTPIRSHKVVATIKKASLHNELLNSGALFVGSKNGSRSKERRLWNTNLWKGMNRMRDEWATHGKERIFSNVRYFSYLISLLFSASPFKTSPHRFAICSSPLPPRIKQVNTEKHQLQHFPPHTIWVLICTWWRKASGFLHAFFCLFHVVAEGVKSSMEMRTAKMSQGFFANSPHPSGLAVQFWVMPMPWHWIAILNAQPQLRFSKQKVGVPRNRVMDHPTLVWCQTTVLVQHTAATTTSIITRNHTTQRRPAS